MSIIEIESLATEYRQLQQEIEQLKDHVNQIKAELISEMDARNSENLQAGLFTIRYTIFEQRRPDSAKLKAHGLYDEYSKSSTQTRFQVA